MKKLYFLVALILLIAVPFSHSAELSAVISRISLATDGTGANGASLRSSISPSGKLLAFDSLANNLIKIDTNNAADIFIREAGTNSKIFRTSTGRKRIQANGPSSNPSISAQTPNGAYIVAYESDASNLARSKKLPDTNGVQDIYATLFPKSFTIRISRAVDGGLSNGRSETPDVTIVPEPNRLFVVYASKANNLSTNDQNSFNDIYLTQVTAPGELKENTDLEKKLKSTRISVSASGSEVDGDSSAPKISGDGNFIVYESEASNLLVGAAITNKQIYLYDVKTKTTSLVSKSSAGVAGNNNSRSASINYNGRYIVYISTSSNIYEDGVSGYQVLRYDRLNNKTERVNVTAAGIPGNGEISPLLTARTETSGRFVIFSDRADNLVANDDNSLIDVFVKDMDSGLLEKISNASDGSSTNAASLLPAINRTDFTALTGLATFASAATNVVTNDIEGVTDLFLTQLSFTPPALSASTTLDVPPTISLSGKTAKLTFEKFNIAPIATKRIAARATNSKLQYAITYSRDASQGARKETVKLQSKKNVISLKNLRPGTYSASYKAQVVQGKKIVSQSSKSPIQRFTIS